VIDYFAKWTSEAAAKQDAYRLRQYFGTDGGTIVKDWYLNQFLPNVQVWRPSQDFRDTAGNLEHVYLIGWFGILALDYVEPVIINDNSLAFALNRDGPPYVIKNNIGSVITDVAVAPIFAGSHYPLGGIN
jgi:hypothetical protein